MIFFQLSVSKLKKHSSCVFHNVQCKHSRLHTYTDTHTHSQCILLDNDCVRTAIQRWFKDFSKATTAKVSVAVTDSRYYYCSDSNNSESQFFFYIIVNPKNRLLINKICCWSFVNKLHQVWAIFPPRKVLSTEIWQPGTSWYLETTYARLAYSILAIITLIPPPTFISLINWWIIKRI